MRLMRNRETAADGSDIKAVSAATYATTADHFDDPALSFWDRFGHQTVARIGRVFQWRGMGTLIINAIGDRDRYVIMGWLLVVGLIVVVGNIVADLLYAVLDPRIRYG